MGSLAIDELNRQRENVKIITLSPGQIWGVNKTEVKSEVCYHDWKEVVLFTSTVTECKKCGEKRDK